MLEVCYEISNKKTGEICKKGSGKFESIDDFFDYMNWRYGYNTKNYHFYYCAG